MNLKMTEDQAIKLAIEVLVEKDKKHKGKVKKYLDAAIRLALLQDVEIRYAQILCRYFSKIDILLQMEKLDSVANFPKKRREELKEDYKYINERWR